ncbi:cytochrome ubiquinol oxidase subunit I [Pseudalkalibacillus berkeleyi]|uniref:Cytochrome ubiquinol oxidase subunit I n=1 Tax=Pseudalkalibacillus berkeleyi TaxID=1069813 RepID=A0ABS9GZ34_9BACL|nr:cytochrome ubiquinol oxidase subunit I [Pseudalkalibacillus berkeleyi]MCF6136926.1 cytochrome ubiquinol oxidase subunit I [Pseudalkalibacillus berkeleyi]
MPELDSAMLSRLLTSLTLGFHILFATLGVGVPLLISGAEWIGIRRKDNHYRILARRWTRGFVVTVAVGVVTGTCIGLQLSLLWPSFMEVAGQVIGLPLFLETFAFFFEAIFLGIYLYTWDRFENPYYHWLLSVPVVIGSTASAFFISTVNAFMNSPKGFKLDNGQITEIKPLIAMFNPATPTKASHVISTAYLTSAFVLAAITAFLILKKGNSEYYRKALHFTMVTAFVFAIATVVIGDFSGKYLAKYQPEKLAAAEWHFETEKGADLIVGGILGEDGEVKYGLHLPNFLSILAHGDPNAEVIGLNEFPEDETAPLFIHYLFDLMIGIGMFLAALSTVFLILSRWRQGWQHSKLILWTIVAAGPLALLAIEFGWIFSEVGRQPWILWHVMETVDGATTSEHVGAMFILFFALYVVLGWICISVLLKMFRNNPVETEFEQMDR